MLILKACPKCKGDLAAETSVRRMSDDSDIICIQCGYTLPLEQQKSLFARLLSRTQPAVLERVPEYART
ncbi:MAG TPA: hypothetical protein VIM45_02135 [Dehalococcoidia bacterium]